MGTKVFKNLDEQLEILRNKNLVIPDEEEAKKVLLRENYFFINGYRHLFTDGGRNFIKGTEFDELYATFLFDRRIRNIMFKYILVIENNVKSIISYQLSKKYGFKEKDYLNEKNYNQDTIKTRQVKDVINKMKRQIRKNGKQHSATLHYTSNYGYIPMWVLVKVLSMGIVSELYNILKEEDKEAINQYYNIDSETMSIYLSILSNYRNLCAHEDIIYDYRAQRQIPDNYVHAKLDIPKVDGEYKYGKNDLFCVLIIFSKLLEDREFRDLIGEVGYEIDVLDGYVNTVPLNDVLNKIGFPSNWRDIQNG